MGLSRSPYIGIAIGPKKSISFGPYLILYFCDIRFDIEYFIRLIGASQIFTSYNGVIALVASQHATLNVPQCAFNCLAQNVKP